MSNSGEWSAPDRFSGNEVELVDEIVLSEDILDEDGSVIGEHVETIDILEVDGQGVVVIDDVTIVTDDEGDLMIDETVAIFDEDGDVVLDEIITIVDAEGDVMVEEHLIAADAEGNVVIADSITIVDGGELDDRQLASALREELDGVELALERLDAGSYGLWFGGSLAAFDPAVRLMRNRAGRNRNFCPVSAPSGAHCQGRIGVIPPPLPGESNCHWVRRQRGQCSPLHSCTIAERWHRVCALRVESSRRCLLSVL
jgi:hypothetical protein